MQSDVDSDFDLHELVLLRDELGGSVWREISDEAQVVAYYLRCHPKVERVRYPGMKSDPQYGEAARTLVGGFGPFLRYCVAGEWHAMRCRGGDPKQTILKLEQAL